jgi:hypothetical protein
VKAAHFRVVALLEMASRPQIATVTVDRAAGLFSVRPLRRRRVYTLPLADVAGLVVRGMIRAEVLERARAKNAARKMRRRR